MISGLHRQFARAVRAGIELDEIEELVIDSAPLHERDKAALWLYAEALAARRDASMPTSTNRALVEA